MKVFYLFFFNFLICFFFDNLSDPKCFLDPMTNHQEVHRNPDFFAS